MKSKENNCGDAVLGEGMKVIYCDKKEFKKTNGQRPCHAGK